MKGVPFDLEMSDIAVPERCPILGIKLERGVGQRTYQDSSPSLDRIIPNKGYVKDNIAVISMRANRIKNDATLDEMRSVVDFVERNTNCVCR